jgi:hypothetical protein
MVRGKRPGEQTGIDEREHDGTLAMRWNEPDMSALLRRVRYRRKLR